jgi:hypothetical protein
MQVQCPNCGQSNPAESVFCGSCGATLAGADVGQAASPAVNAGEGGDPATQEGPEAGEFPVGEGGEAMAPEDEYAWEPSGWEGEYDPGPAGPEEASAQQPPGLEGAIVQEPKPPPEVADRADVTPSKEVLYYSDDMAVVATERAVLGGETYLLADILSVSMAVKSTNRVPSALVALLGAGITLFALIGARGDPLLGIILTVGGLALLAVGLLLTITARARYVVRLETGQGEVDALASPDRYRVERIVRAVERAMAGTG